MDVNVINGFGRLGSVGGRLGPVEQLVWQAKRSTLYHRKPPVTLNRIISLGCKAGVALNPAAPLGAIRSYLPLLSKVTIMIVDAGYAGQRIIPQMYDKIRALARWREEGGFDFLIEAEDRKAHV